VLQDLTAESFSEQLGTRFRIFVDEANSMEVELCEVARHEKHPGSRRDPFSLYFRGHPQSYLPQAIYRVEHERMGTMEIFLVPIGPDAQGMRYEAVFN
jgi:Domain of unknown function (DUF6916)